MSIQILLSISLARCLTANRSVSKKIDNKIDEIEDQIADISIFYIDSS